MVQPNCIYKYLFTYWFFCICFEYFEIVFTLFKSLNASILWIKMSIMFTPINTLLVSCYSVNATVNLSLTFELIKNLFHIEEILLLLISFSSKVPIQVVKGVWQNDNPYYSVTIQSKHKTEVYLVYLATRTLVLWSPPVQLHLSLPWPWSQ